MIQKPKLKDFLTVFPISDSTWGLRGASDELWRMKIRDRRGVDVFGQVLPYLDGRHALDAIVAELERREIQRTEVLQLLERMEQAHLLEEGDAGGLSPDDVEHFRSQITFFSRYSSDGGALRQARLLQTRVGVIGEGALVGCVLRQLAASGFGEIVALGGAASAWTPADGGAAHNGRSVHFEALDLSRESIWPDGTTDRLPQLFVVALEGEDPQLLEAMDAFSKRRKLPWLLLRASDAQGGWVGPLFVPDETACYRSLQARLFGNMQYFSEQQAFERHLKQEGRAASPCGGLHAFFELLAAIAVVESVKYVTGINVPHLAGRFVTVSLTNWDTESHDVLRVPGLGLDEASRPQLFAWKEIPYADIEAQRPGQLQSRRS